MLEREPLLRSELSVIFYEEAGELVDAVADFASEGESGAVAVIIASAELRARLQRRINDGRFVDASKLLDTFCAERVIDQAAFRDHVGALVRIAGNEGPPVRVFGEMGALLWERGLVSQAVELQALWTDLAREMPFALLCAYPSTLVLDHDEPALVNDVFAPHTSVRTPKPADFAAVRAFASSPHSIRESRRFVARAIEGAAPHQTDKLLLIVSELATNAVQHAQTPFVVEIVGRGSGICVSVRDRSRKEIGVEAAPMESENGRGLSLVDSISDDWGVRFTAQGKVVWAQIEAD